jgi:NAD(P)-dependent dehydrogenase (short-subunit alcohol dehydrogenase family)
LTVRRQALRSDHGHEHGHEADGTVAIVTGGNGGLGMARGLVAAGARVVVGRDHDKSLAAVAEIVALGPGGALAIDTDVTEEAALIS